MRHFIAVAVAWLARRAVALKVLGFGDSLTAGQHDCSRANGTLVCEFEPYAPHVERWLVDSSPLEELILVVSTGLCGASARGMVLDSGDATPTVDGGRLGSARDFAGGLSRVGLGATLGAHAAFGAPVDVVVVLAGTNDLLDERSDPRAVAADVWALHSLAHARGARTLALEIPPCPSCTPGFEARRAATNAAVKEAAAEAKAKTYHWQCRYVPWPRAAFSAGGEMYDGDGLHLSPAGSRALGDWLGHALLDSLRFWRCADGGLDDGAYVLGLPVSRPAGDGLVAGASAAAIAAALLETAPPQSVERCPDAACVGAAVERSLEGRGVVLRNDRPLCYSYWGAKPWLAEDDDPLFEFKIDMGERSDTLRGDDPLKMAEYFVDTQDRPLLGGGCFDRDCYVELIRSSIEMAHTATVAHPSDSYELAEAEGGAFDAPLVVACSGLGLYGHQRADHLNYEFKRLVTRTFGRNVHQLFLRDLERRWYLSGLVGLGRGAAGAAAGVARLLDERGLEPRRTVYVGDSMGGFGALLLGALGAADVVLAFVPQTFAAPQLLALHGDRRWPIHADAGAAFPEHADLGAVWAALQDGGCASRAVVFYGEDPVDVAHAEHVGAASSCVEVRQYAVGGPTAAKARHEVFTKALRDDGVLREALHEALPDPAYWNASDGGA